MDKSNPIDITDLIRICTSTNPLVTKAARALLEQLRAHLATKQTDHLVFAEWQVTHKNPPGPNHRTIHTAKIHTNNQINKNWIQLILSIKDTGCIHYRLMPNAIMDAPNVPISSMTAINPIHNPADIHGFVAEIMETIHTHITPVPTLRKDGYFI